MNLSIVMKSLGLFLLLFPICLFAQSFKYEIKGSIKNAKPGQKVYFVHFGESRNIDSAVLLTDRSFNFKGKADISNEPEENYKQSAARIFIDHTGKEINFNVYKANTHWDMTTVYLEPGVTQVTIADSAYNAVITPPAVNQGHYTLDSIYTAVFKKTQQSRVEMLKKYGNTTLYTKWQAYNEYTYKEEQKKDLWAFVKTHPASPVSLYVLKHNDEYYADYDQVEPYYTALAPTLKNTEFSKTYAAKVAGLKITRIGAAAPEFTMKDTNGKKIALSSFKGKYVFVDFWASWCGPCRRENPSVVKAYQQFNSANFTMLGVSLDQEKDAWLKAIADDHLEWAQVSDLQYWQNAAAKLYAVSYIPQNFLIDPQGKIIARNLFGNNLVKKLKEVLAVEGK